MRRRSFIASTAVGSAAITAGCSGILPGGSGSGDPSTFTIGSFQANSEWIETTTLQPFREGLNERYGDVTLDYQGGEAIGGAGELYDLAADGVAEITNDLPAYQGGRMPLNNLIQQPGTWPAEPKIEETRGATQAYHNMITPGGSGTDALYQEYANLGVRPILGYTPSPYQLITHNTLVEEPGDVSGLNLRAAGPSKSDIAESLDMSSQRIAAPDMFNAHQQGTTDADILAVDVAISYNFQEVTNYITSNLHLGGFAVAFVVGQDTWDSWSEELQNAIDETAKEVAANYNERYRSVSEERVFGTDKIVQAPADFSPNDEQMYVYPTDAAEEITARMDNVLQSWVEDQESQGRPGQEVLDTFQEKQRSFV